MSDVERRILKYMACHPLVLMSHVKALLDVQELGATERLDALVAAGLIRHGPRLHHQQAGYQITALGLGEIGSVLPVPRVDLRRYWHQLGVAWLWLAAHRRAFGEVDRVYCEREMKAADDDPTAAVHDVDPGWSPPVRSKAAESSFAIRLEGDASHPQGGLHYPDLMLVGPQGRVGIQLQLTPVGHRRLDKILTGYAFKPSTAAVLYLVEASAIGDVVQAAAARLGLARAVHVQRVLLDPAAH